MFHVIFSYLANKHVYFRIRLFRFYFFLPTHIFIYYEIFFKHMKNKELEKSKGNFSLDVCGREKVSILFRHGIFFARIFLEWMKNQVDVVLWSVA